MSRVLGTAPTVADAIIDQLCSVRDRATDAHLPAKPRRSGPPSCSVLL